MLVVVVGIALAVFVQRGTTQILDALAEEVLQQQHDVANLLHEYSGVMLALEREGNSSDDKLSRESVDYALEQALLQLQKMRFQYSFERLDGAATAHAFVKPILEDVGQWLTEGLPGYEATDPVVLAMASQRLSDRYEQLRRITAETDVVATSLITEQSDFLTRFRGSLISLLGLFALLAMGIAALLIRQRNLQMRLRMDQEKNAQRIADFANIGADWFWEMTSQFKLKVLPGQALNVDQSFPGTDNVHEQDSLFAEYNNTVADVHWPIDSLNSYEEFLDFESDWINTGGDKRIIAMSGKPLFGPDGEFTGYRGIGRDITKRRNIEIELEAVYEKLIDAQTRGREQAEEALRESEQFLRISLDAMAANIAILDENGFIRLANKSWKSMAIGAVTDGGVGSHYFEALHSGSTADGVSGLAIAKISIDEVLAGKRSSLQYEFPCQSSDGLHWMVIHLTTFISIGLRYAVLVYEDITERRKLEEQDRRLRAELAHVARLTTVGEMATVLAHELNQPLTAISHNSDALLSTLQDFPDASPEVIETVSDIYEQAHRAGGIIQGMRRMVRKDANSSIKVDINQLVVETVRLTHPEAREHNVSVQLQLAEGLPELLIDPVQIQQVLVNLERNGVEAIRNHGSKTRKLYITTVRFDEEFIRVTVQDTGPGVTQEVETSLFKSFHTTKLDGMGVGLSISRSIVEAHGGRLWLDGSESGMTTFHFTLPAIRTKQNANL